MTRAQFVVGALAAAAEPRGTLADIESASGGRLGVAVVDSHGNTPIRYRAGERFIMCSTFKLLAVGALLSRVDAGREHLDRRVTYGPRDLLEYAPVTRTFVRRGWMTLDELCDAATIYSDNTAANIIVRALGGPPAVTQFARRLGDEKTRLDRIEPQLNRPGPPGDVRDTTTPEAMARDARHLLLGDALTVGSRARLTRWLDDSVTGTDLLRAGFPSSWRVGDKTGLGGRHNAFGDSDTRNDVAIVQPPGRPAFIVSAYLTGAQVRAEIRDRALADVGRFVYAERISTTHVPMS